MLRPIPGDPWGIEQHHWNTGAKENQQLNPGGPSNRQKKNENPSALSKVIVKSTSKQIRISLQLR